MPSTDVRFHTRRCSSVLNAESKGAGGSCDYPPERTTLEDNIIDHPTHYTQGNIEVTDFIIDQKFNFLEGAIVKYICRYKYKNGLEDLKKARWYLNKLITTEELNAKENN